VSGKLNVPEPAGFMKELKYLIEMVVAKSAFARSKTGDGFDDLIKSSPEPKTVKKKIIVIDPVQIECLLTQIISHHPVVVNIVLLHDFNTLV
jgi:hypothetical protein